MPGDNGTASLDLFPPFGAALASVSRDRSAADLPEDVRDGLRAVAGAYRRGAQCKASRVEYGLVSALSRWRAEWVESWSADASRGEPVGRMAPFLSAYADALRELSGHEAVKRAPRHVRDVLADLEDGYDKLSTSVGMVESGRSAVDIAKPLAELTSTDWWAIARFMVWRAEWRLRRRRRA